MKVYGSIQGLDKDGFEVGSISLSGIIPPAKTLPLSNKSFMRDEAYRSITKWQTKDLSWSATSRPNVMLTDATMRLMEGPDSSRDVWFAVKVDLRNEGGTPVQRASLRAVDADDFTLHNLILSGDVPANGSGSLTMRTFMPHSDYKKIAAWRLSD
jgi:hypothetical protein